MNLNYFKDCLFDLINEWDSLDITDIEVQDRSDTITITVRDGSIFEIKCKAVYEYSNSDAEKNSRLFP